MHQRLNYTKKTQIPGFKDKFNIKKGRLSGIKLLNILQIDLFNYVSNYRLPRRNLWQLTWTFVNVDELTLITGFQNTRIIGL